jgi:hypothetical protein
MQSKYLFRESPFQPIFLTILAAGLIGGGLFYLEKEQLEIIKITATAVILLSVYFFITFKTFIVTRESITVKTPVFSKIIYWHDVLTTSTILRGNQLWYQIRTKNKVLQFPKPNKFDDFENFVASVQHRVNY